MNHPLEAWPAPETSYRTLFLAPEGQLLTDPPAKAHKIQYQSDVAALQIDDDSEEIHFRFTFTKRVCLLGAAKVLIYVSCTDADDMDLFFQLRKQDSSGKILRYHNIPEKDIQAQGLAQNDLPLLNTLVYLGPHGQIRASHRKIDETISTPHWISHEHLVEEKITPGTVVCIETSIWPGGIIFEPLETLVFKVAGHPMYLAEFPTMRGQFKAQNKGKHTIHLGSSYPSHIVVPFLAI